MKIQSWKNRIGWLLMLLVSSCVEPYFPEVLDAPNAFLVVNGFVNANGSTTIQLLRTQNLTDTKPPRMETGAFVTIEAENGVSYKLVEKIGSGVYIINGLTLDTSQKYRLFIRTKQNKEYASDYVEVKTTPAIDQVTWKPVGDELQIFVSTHDPNNKTWYYRWEFEDTWHFKTALTTNLIFRNGRVEYRDTNDKPIFDCWTSETSSTIELSTSKKLNQDIISNYRLASIPYTAEKIAIKYSTLVKQYALTRPAYEYWETLKKNTENIGTLFDPLPSQLNSNIRCLTSPGEPVIGYLSISSVQQKRMFVDRKELPEEWRTWSPYCAQDTLLFSEADYRIYFKDGNVVPVNEVYLEDDTNPVGYTYAPRSCVDCTTRGTNVKPDFWE